MIAKLVLLIALTLPLRAQGWTKTDTALEISTQALFFVDWRQTSGFHRNPDLYEGNPFLPRNPPQAKINRFFAGMVLGHFAISYALKGNSRRAWQLTTLVIQANYVKDNVYIGAKIAW